MERHEKILEGAAKMCVGWKMTITYSNERNRKIKVLSDVEEEMFYKKLNLENLNLF